MFRAGAIAVAAMLFIAAAPIPLTAQNPHRVENAAQPNNNPAQSNQSSPQAAALQKNVGASANNRPASQIAINPPAEEPIKITDWIVAASAVATTLFTLVLAISTWLLWRETERLAGGADDQAEKMVKGINATMAVADKTKEVADAMEEAASAMRQMAGVSDATLRHSQKATEQQLRAYVLVCQATQQQHNDSSFIYRVAFKNYGQTPAYNVVIQRRIIWSPPVEPDFGRDRMEILPSATIGPGGEMQFTLLSPTRLDRGEFLKVLSGEKRFYVLGRASYTDAFDQRRETSFDLVSHTSSIGELCLSPREGGKNYSN